MPRAPRICSEDGCVGRVKTGRRLGFCDLHQPKNPEPWKRTTDYGPRLDERTVQAILRRDPVCYDPHRWSCRNKSTDVDHLVPRWRGGKDSLDNLKGICNTCHRRKSSLEGVEARRERRK